MTLAADSTYRCLYCPLCEAGPFVNLGNHVTRKHGREHMVSRVVDGRRIRVVRGTFTPAMSEDARFMRRALWDDRSIKRFRKRRTTCAQGHALRGHNRLPAGACRKCTNERWRAQWRKLHPALGRRSCAECGSAFSPREAKNVYCSSACKQRGAARARQAGPYRCACLRAFPSQRGLAVHRSRVGCSA